jgi:hypothetical protein
MNTKSKINQTVRQVLGFDHATPTVRLIILIVGIGLVCVGLFIKSNIGVLALYLMLSAVMGIAQHMKAGFFATCLLMIPVMILGLDAKFYELLYLFGSLLIAHALALKIVKEPA